LISDGSTPNHFILSFHEYIKLTNKSWSFTIEFWNLSGAASVIYQSVYVIPLFFILVTRSNQGKSQWALE
jgi:hypothetical protein